MGLADQPDTIEVLAKAAGINLLIVGGLRLICSFDCQKIIATCKAQKVLILGLDGFIVKDRRPCADPNLIADYSELDGRDWDSSCNAAADAAQRFVSIVQNWPGVYFEFTLHCKGESKP